ncbi:MAG: glycosyltransferase family 4 protein [bacterium]
MKLLLAAWMYPHHNASSGYGQLCRFVDAACIRSTDVALAQAPEGSLRWQFGRKWFDARILMAAARSDLVHFLYAENHLRLLFAAARCLHPRVKLVGTVHLPLDYYSLPHSIAALQKLDGIITLTSGQADEVHGHLPDKIVRFIPHGCIVDHPHRDRDAHREAASFNIAVVGSNYRDWTVLKSVMQQAADRHLDWRFHLIGLPAGRRREFESLPSAIVHSRLAEAEYYGVLNRSHVLFMPVTFATANNALLEAHSVGLPAVCTDLPGVRDYAVSSTALFSGAENALNLLHRLHDMSDDTFRGLRDQTRREGKTFSWPQIAQRVLEVYNLVCRG